MARWDVAPALPKVALWPQFRNAGRAIPHLSDIFMEGMSLPLFNIDIMIVGSLPLCGIPSLKKSKGWGASGNSDTGRFVSDEKVMI